MGRSTALRDGRRRRTWRGVDLSSGRSAFLLERAAQRGMMVGGYMGRAENASQTRSKGKSVGLGTFLFTQLIDLYYSALK